MDSNERQPFLDALYLGAIENYPPSALFLLANRLHSRNRIVQH